MDYLQEDNKVLENENKALLANEYTSGYRSSAPVNGDRCKGIIDKKKNAPSAKPKTSVIAV